MWKYVCEWGRKQGMTEKEKIRRLQGSGTHWWQKSPNHLKFALNGADCSISILNTEMQQVETNELGIQSSQGIQVAKLQAQD